MRKDCLRLYGPAGFGVAYLFAAAAVTCVLLPAGCGASGSNPTTQPVNAIERQDQALKDPFGYSPSFKEKDISGGGITDLDKPGLKRDFNEVFNP